MGPKVAAVAGDDRRGSGGLVSSSTRAVTALGGIDTGPPQVLLHGVSRRPAAAHLRPSAPPSSVKTFFELSSLSISSSASSTCRFIAGLKRKAQLQGLEWGWGSRKSGKAGCELAGRSAAEEPVVQTPSLFKRQDTAKWERASCRR